MKKFKQFFKEYHLHWLLLRGVLIAPLAVLFRLGEWAWEAADWLCDNLPNPNKEQ